MTPRLRCISPIDDSIYVERPYADIAQIQAVLNRAATAQKFWAATALDRRKRICAEAIEVFLSKKEAIAQEICCQMGRPIRSAGGEVDGMVDRARTMIGLAEQGLAPVNLAEQGGVQRWIQREALGVVFIIAPWNYPYLTAINAVVPAILAGNAVVIKHSAQTPLCAERLVEAFGAAGLPSGVFQYLHLTHENAENIIKDSRISHVAFTGSVPGGAMVEKAAAGRFISLGLELGGKDPAYVRGDADLDHAVNTVMDGAFFNSGQSCCGIERIYVHAGIFEAFVEKSVNWVNALKLGRPDDPGTTLGPLVKSAAADFVRGQIQEALDQGATAHILAGAFPMDQPGTPYMAPQILTQVNHGMRVMTQESFGPVVGIQNVASDEEAVTLMNDSEFGLTASIFTRDIETGLELGRQVETGTFFINRCDHLDPELAWTGIKNSGRGCTLSVLGFESLTRPKSFHIKTQ